MLEILQYVTSGFWVFIGSVIYTVIVLCIISGIWLNVLKKVSDQKII